MLYAHDCYVHAVATVTIVPVYNHKSGDDNIIMIQGYRNSIVRSIECMYIGDRDDGIQQ